MNKYSIKNWGTKEIIYEDESLEAALENGVRKGISFSGADLMYLKIRCLDLTNGNFSNAMFEFSILLGCNLKNVIFENAYMCQASFIESNLTRANLKNAKLIGAFFSGAILDVKIPPVDDAYFISEILWRNAKTENQKYLASRIRMEWHIDNRWKYYKKWSKKLKIYEWMKDILYRWPEFRKILK